jgi:VanZ family protein
MRSNGFWRYQFPAILWAVFILSLSSIPSSVLPISPPIHFDKLFHAAIFFIFCYLLSRAFLHQTRYPLFVENYIVLSLLVVIAYGISDELYQTLLPGRSPDVYDALADSFGGLLCTLYLLLRNRRAKRPAQVDQERPLEKS